MWKKESKAAKHAGVCPNTLREWRKMWLPFSRLPSGTILYNLKKIDAFLEKFETTNKKDEKDINQAVDEIISEFSSVSQ